MGTGEGFLNAYVVLRVFADCEADADCAASYPGIRQRAVDLLARLEVEPLVRDDGMEVSADDLAGLLLSSISLQKRRSNDSIVETLRVKIVLTTKLAVGTAKQSRNS